MDVEVFAERLLERGDVGDLREQSELDLRIVRGKELETLRRDERAANPASLLGADRNVLQVGIE